MLNSVSDVLRNPGFRGVRALFNYQLH